MGAEPERGPLAALAATARLPLFRNGYALALNAGVTSVLGVVFWLLAARRFTPAEVGIGSTLVAAAMLLATVAQLSLPNALNRFVPCAGHQTARLVATSYAAVVVLAIAGAAASLAVMDRWLPEVSVVTHDPALAVWFVAALAFWCVFVLQDAALTGLRRAGWVLVENTVYGVAKIGALFMPAIASAGHGIFLAWTVPLLPIVVVVNVVLFGRLLPVRESPRDAAARPIRPGVVGRFVAADYAAALVSTGLICVLPLLVVHGAGVEAAAYFSLAWSISYALYLVSRAMTSSLLVEAAADPGRLGEYSYRVATQTALLLAPPVAVIVLFAPLLLRVFGADYATEGATLLRLLALASLPTIIIAVYSAVERVRGHMSSLVKVTLVINAAALALSHVLLRRWGVAGVGAAWLAVQSGAAAALLATRLGPLWMAELGMAKLTPLLRSLGAIRDRAHRPRQIAAVTPILPDVIRALQSPELRIRQVLPSVGDVTIAILDSGDDESPTLLKLARTHRGAAALEREVEVLSTLASDPRLDGWGPQLPAVLTSTRSRERVFVVEQFLAGCDGRTVLRDPSTGPRALTVALAAIADLHECTARKVVIDKTLLHQWVDEPLGVLDSRLHRRAPHLVSAVGGLGDLLHESLDGRTVTVSRVHGDLAPGNVLFSPDGRAVVGIIDWERSVPTALPQLDIVHLLLSTRMLVTGRELGDVVVPLLDRSTPVPVRSPLAERRLVLLTWLHHVAGILDKTDRYANHPVWMPRNVEHVLRAITASNLRQDPAA